MILYRDKAIEVCLQPFCCVNLLHFLPESIRSGQNGTKLEQKKTKGAMNKMKLKQNEIGKNLSRAEWRKSHPKQYET